ncbi:hypothetical protein SATMO3_58000 [Sporomusa aerivorans]
MMPPPTEASRVLAEIPDQLLADGSRGNPLRGSIARLPLI